ncbi:MULTISPECIES: OmpA family protein [unclassified Pseudomonas]|uniref:OmpA family protein n=1 Tax=unclassified Pseudomonas TaxID=196821 RepID=UPI000BD7AB84|nr:MULTISPECIES: OmpA family protein [unclassified Pseudomonas]PVZ16059.1 outer membrane protein OmpA-like peptidoglycan-associated protein [Pseudomonas sp. URIL14HWK12:I12]PVZ26085.1 outer membrane protein OmpA-like peptidoglycan-associated protein [Pseudomonas sp. URIL14HWK12:I10]PVZ36391.1 outer membrane protein OmpA-like peptidoglycan-associated protein [Pseudomonas sp. URIL14HWK12:I11]SNZ18453.1 Outer membrane protein OmpA [Pseudomonas sp. URIL14HWK12:I9]
MRNHVMIPALLALSVGLAACSTPPNPALEQARSNYTSLQTNPKSQTYAALETKDASEWLDKADKAYRNDDDAKKVDQLSYLANQRVEYAKQTIAMKSAEDELKNAASERAKAQLAARDAQIKKLQDSLNAKQTDRGTVVTFGDVLFDLNKAELKAAGMNNVAQLAQFLRDNPERQVIVEGYTDSTGSDSYNQSLSERRANSVRAALVKMGVEPNRVIAQGYGKDYAVADNSSASGRAMNRRVEVTISNDNQPVAPRTH